MMWWGHTVCRRAFPPQNKPGERPMNPETTKDVCRSCLAARQTTKPQTTYRQNERPSAYFQRPNFLPSLVVKLTPLFVTLVRRPHARPEANRQGSISFG